MLDHLLKQLSSLTPVKSICVKIRGLRYMLRLSGGGEMLKSKNTCSTVCTVERLHKL